MREERLIPATVLADELREVAERLSVRDVDPAAIEAATVLARDLRNLLDGPPLPRWYEVDFQSPSQDPAERDAYTAQSPLRGVLNPIAPPIDIEYAERDDGRAVVRGRVRLGRRYEGPPHGVHGGIVAALFDEVLGGAQWIAPPMGVTAKLEVTYREITPVERGLLFEAWIEEDRGRRVTARATCHAGDVLTAQATAIFMRVDFEALHARKPPPEP